MRTLTSATLALLLLATAALANENWRLITCKFDHPDFAQSVQVYLDETEGRARPLTEIRWTQAQFTDDFIVIGSNYPHTPLIYSIVISRRYGAATFITGPDCDTAGVLCDESRAKAYQGSCAARF